MASALTAGTSTHMALCVIGLEMFSVITKFLALNVLSIVSLGGRHATKAPVANVAQNAGWTQIVMTVSSVMMVSVSKAAMRTLTVQVVDNASTINVNSLPVVQMKTALMEFALMVNVLSVLLMGTAMVVQLASPISVLHLLAAVMMTVQMEFAWMENVLTA